MSETLEFLTYIFLFNPKAVAVLTRMAAAVLTLMAVAVLQPNPK